MSRTRRVLLQPLPLFDEASLLTAFAECTPPIAGIHATTVWKVLLKHELDQFHPGYIERMNSRMGSRATSRMGSRITSRRPSIGATEEESKEEGGDAERSAAAAASSIASPSNKSALKSKHTITEGDEDQAQEEAAIDTSDAISIASSASFGALPSPSSASSLTASADDLAQFELERQARLKLEAEDDALLMGLNTFPLSKFNPTPEELADESNPLCTKPILPGSIPTVPARLYAVLAEKFSYLTSRLVSHKTSGDGSTTKLLIRLQDGQHIESVIMRHKQKDVATGNVEQRITLCVSSQVGCAMGCTFCATGTMGLRGNLMMGEIVEQLIIANRFEKIRNIVFMGMGEPLKNYEQVLSAIRAMTDGNRFGLAPSRITLSTVGVIPKMLELTRDIPAIQLALSLHAPTQELRQKIVPTAKAWPIEKLIEAADYFIQRSKKRILMEYVLLDGVNASEKEAHELGKLLQGKDVMINLIPYNSTSVAAHYRAPPRATSERFQRILTDEYQLFTTIRVEMGADIDGACGQLALENQALQWKPRGLHDDTATADLSGLPGASSCGSTEKKSLDIEDLGRSTPNSGAAVKKGSAAVIKKRGTPSASPPAAATSSSACCESDPSKLCDCQTSPASPSASPTADEIASIEQKSEDDLTVGELLKLAGLKSHAEIQHAASQPPVPIALHSAPYLTDADKLILAQQRERRSWQVTDKVREIVMGMILVFVGVVLLNYKNLPS